MAAAPPLQPAGSNDHTNVGTRGIGELDVRNGGTLTTSDTFVGSNNTADNATGTVTVQSGGTIVSNIHLRDGGTLGGDGTVDGNVTLVGDTATITPGTSPGILTISNGNLSVNPGMLDFEINGSGAGPLVAGTDFDQINVTNGNANLQRGTIRLNFGSGSPFFSAGSNVSLITANAGVTLAAAAFALEIVGSNDPSFGIIVEDNGAISSRAR